MLVSETVGECPHRGNLSPSGRPTNVGSPPPKRTKRLRRWIAKSGYLQSFKLEPISQCIERPKWQGVRRDALASPAAPAKGLSWRGPVGGGPSSHRWLGLVYDPLRLDQDIKAAPGFGMNVTQSGRSSESA